MLLEISNTVRNFLVSSLPELDGSKVTVICSADGAAKGRRSDKLVLFLYEVGESPNMRNEFRAVVDQADSTPPLALNLRYLLFFDTGDHADSLRMLSNVLELFHARPLLGPDEMDPGLVGRVEHLTITLESPGTEELNDLWSALGIDLKLALYYEVRATLVKSTGERRQR